MIRTFSLQLNRLPSNCGFYLQNGLQPTEQVQVAGSDGATVVVHLSLTSVTGVQSWSRAVVCLLPWSDVRRLLPKLTMPSMRVFFPRTPAFYHMQLDTSL